MKLFTCPKAEYEFHGALKEGQKCPKCGALAEGFSFSESVHLHEERSKYKGTHARTI
jgi:transcription initiation factor IIE alpha subunit